MKKSECALGLKLTHNLNIFYLYEDMENNMISLPHAYIYDYLYDLYDFKIKFRNNFFA